MTRLQKLMATNKVKRNLPREINPKDYEWVLRDAKTGRKIEWLSVLRDAYNPSVSWQVFAGGSGIGSYGQHQVTAIANVNPHMTEMKISPKQVDARMHYELRTFDRNKAKP